MANDIDPVKLAAWRHGMEVTIDQLKAKLDNWVDQQGGPDTFRNPAKEDPDPSPYYTEMTSALLETAIDRQIHLLGVSDAKDAIVRTFERRAEAFRLRLQ